MSFNYNNFNRINSFNRINNKKSKHNGFLLFIFLLVLGVLVYFLSKHSYKLRDVYDWITGQDAEENIEYEEESLDQMVKVQKEKQIFNIKENIFTYEEAKLLCSLYDSELATLENLIEGYKYGANWCNMGWSEDQLALYPIQRQYWEKLNMNSNNTSCGFPGINGGFYKNKNLRFGVNCYGIKPNPKNSERINMNFINKYSEDEETLIKLKSKIGQYTISPFNISKWSEFQ